MTKKVKDAQADQAYLSALVDMPDDLVRNVMEFARTEMKGVPLKEVMAELVKRGLRNAQTPRLPIGALRDLVESAFERARNFSTGREFSTPDLFDLTRYHPTDAKRLGKLFADRVRSSKGVENIGRTQNNMAIYRVTA